MLQTPGLLYRQSYQYNLSFFPISGSQLLKDLEEELKEVVSTSNRLKDTLNEDEDDKKIPNEYDLDSKWKIFPKRILMVFNHTPVSAA